MLFLRHPTARWTEERSQNPVNGRPEIDRPFVRWHTPVEVELADILADVLRLDRLGIHDVFFDPGGHSLPASQVVSRAITAFRVEVAAQVVIRIAHGGADGPGDDGEPGEEGRSGRGGPYACGAGSAHGRAGEGASNTMSPFPNGPAAVLSACWGRQARKLISRALRVCPRDRMRQWPQPQMKGPTIIRTGRTSRREDGTTCWRCPSPMRQPRRECRRSAR